MTPAEQMASTIPAPPPIKVCGCEREYTAADWRCLPLVGRQDDGDGGYLELRNCVCRSTIAVEVSS